ncbi:MAG: hypothetical protein SH820_15210 [Xanthomonadales bacterium]|nr:hypothetical protein [Xanthomonadales bacterium]
MAEESAISAVERSRKTTRAREIWLMVALGVVVLLSSLNFVDDYAETDLDSLFQRALITFALARTLNGVISAVQGTEVALQPAGVGLTLTPGEILDPINDLVERFSWIMLGATISLGIQQVMLDVGQWWGLRSLLAVLALAWLILRLHRKRKSLTEHSAFERALFYALVAAIFIRFAVPVALIANEVVYDLFLESRYLASTQELAMAGETIEGIETGKDGIPGSGTPVSKAPAKSIFGQVIDGARKTLDFERRLEDIKQKTSNLIEHLVQLSVVFILQTGVLPLAFLWLILSLFRFIMNLRPARRLAG